MVNLACFNDYYCSPIIIITTTYNLTTYLLLIAVLAIKIITIPIAIAIIITVIISFCSNL